MGSGWTYPDFPGCLNQPTSDSCARALKQFQFQAMCSSSLPTVERLAIFAGALVTWASGYSPLISSFSLPSAIQSNFRYDGNRPETASRGARLAGCLRLVGNFRNCGVKVNNQCKRSLEAIERSHVHLDTISLVLPFKEVRPTILDRGAYMDSRGT